MILGVVLGAAVDRDEEDIPCLESGRGDRSAARRDIQYGRGRCAEATSSRGGQQMKNRARGAANAVAGSYVDIWGLLHLRRSGLGGG